jgi:RNA polymerase sigma-70 factor (ECF subfamily)
MSTSTEQLVDELLVLDAQSGCAQAMETLVGRWQERLWRYARRLTDDPEAAWDVTQESWIGIVRGIRRLNDPARFRSWAYRIVTNKANDWIKHKAKRHRVPADERVEKPADDGHQASETSADLQVILRRLGERSRAVLTLYYIEEFSLAEIAGILRVPRGTVKSRLHTARVEFKALWQTSLRASQALEPAFKKGESQ